MSSSPSLSPSPPPIACFSRAGDTSTTGHSGRSCPRRITVRGVGASHPRSPTSDSSPHLSGVEKRHLLRVIMLHHQHHHPLPHNRHGSPTNHHHHRQDLLLRQISQHLPPSHILKSSWISRPLPLPLLVRSCSPRPFSPTGRTMLPALTSTIPMRCKRRIHLPRRYGSSTARRKHSYPTRSGWRI